MTKAGLCVPPGFTITTEACNDYFANNERLPEGLLDDVTGAIAALERKSNKRFGSPENPLLVSVRSGAKLSMPGMMDTVLNLGLNDATLKGSSRSRTTSASARTRIGASSRCSAGSSLGVPGERVRRGASRSSKHSAGARTTSISTPRVARPRADYRAIVKRRRRGREFPSDPFEQLELAIDGGVQELDMASARATTASSDEDSATISAPP